MIRLLCVGLGGMGRHDWGAAIAVPDVQPAGGVDLSEQARSDFHQLTGAPTFADYYEALQAVSADAVLIAAPDAFHAPFSIAALEQGLDVICEKPMADSMAAARRMHEAAQRHGRLLMIHHQLRWAPIHYHVRELIEDGAIGRVNDVNFRMSVYSGASLGGYRSQLPHMQLQDLAVHHFDLIRYYSGQECERIFARAWPAREDAATITTSTAAEAILDMTGGVTASYSSSSRALLEQTGYNCAALIHGSAGAIGHDGSEMFLQTHAAAAAGEKPQAISVPVPPIGTWEAFAEAIKTRRPALTDSADNLHSLAVLFAAIESADSGALVSLSQV